MDQIVMKQKVVLSFGIVYNCSFLVTLVKEWLEEKLLQFKLLMERIHSNNPQTHPNINSLSLNNIFLILSFLDPRSIENIIQADNQKNRHKLKLASVARNHAFLKKYLNKTDRTIYMPFYSETLFMKMQEQQILHLCSCSAPVLSYLQESFQLLLTKLQIETSEFFMKEELIQSVIESLTDPELPFPKLRKATIGIHCNSALQFFLVDKLLPSNQQEDLEYTFEEFSMFLSQKWNFSEQNQEIMTDVLKFSFKISYQNFQNYLIPKNTNHNLVVLIIALLDILIDSTNFYVQAIQDPLYAFIEFNLRYCIFRNIILSLENKLGFIFKNYNSFVSSLLESKQQKMRDEGNPEPQRRQMTIWHCGLSKWYIYMQKNHQNNFKNFFYLLKKLNLQNLIEEVEDRINQNITFLQLRNHLTLNQANLLERQIYFDFFSPIEQLLEQKKELYNQVIKQYMEYIVDISINQYSVHWCGHSKQALHIPFQQFDESLLIYFQDYFCKMIKVVKEVDDPSKAIVSTALSILIQFEKDYLKPITLQRFIELVQTQIINQIGEATFLNSQLFNYLSELNAETAQRDKVLSHFNQQANIKNEIDHNYSIVLESENFNKVLKNSASTAVSRTNRLQNLPMTLSLNSNDSIMQDF